MADVAKRCGCTAATVSLALRNDPRISPATRARVRKAATAMSYRPDPVLAALVARRDRDRVRQTFANLAALVDDRWFDSNTSLEWHDALLKGVNDACERLGYSLNVLRIARDLAGASQDRVLRGRGIRGLVLMPVRGDDIGLSVRWKDYAGVAIGVPPERVHWHRVGRDGYAAISLACEQVMALGYRRVGLAHSGNLERRLRHEWLAGLWKECYLRANELHVVPPCLPADFQAADFLEWFRRERPECVFTGEPKLIDWLKKAGFSVPRDVGVVLLSHELTNLAEVAGVSAHPEVFGAAAVEQLHTQLLQGETGFPAVQREILICPHWVDGTSVRKLR